MSAVLNGHLDDARKLIAEGADVNAEDVHGNTVRSGKHATSLMWQIASHLLVHIKIILTHVLNLVDSGSYRELWPSCVPL